MAKELFFEDVKVGDAMPVLVKPPIIKLQHVMYAGASGDFNPLHTDDEFARAVGMKDGVISHGMLVMGFVAQAVTNWNRHREGDGEETKPFGESYFLRCGGSG